MRLYQVMRPSIKPPLACSWSVFQSRFASSLVWLIIDWYKILMLIVFFSLYANYMPTDIGCLKAGFAFYTYKVMIIFGELFHPQWVNESNSEDSSFLISFLDLFLYLHFWNYFVLVNVLWSVTRVFSCPWLVLFRPILCTLSKIQTWSWPLPAMPFQ